MLEEMLTSRPGERSQLSSSAEDRGVNFAMFLTMMSEHLFEFDAEAELIEAFSSFDESDSGTVRCDEIRKWLSETGDRMNQAEVRVCSVVPGVPGLVSNCAYSDRQIFEGLLHRPSRKF